MSRGVNSGWNVVSDSDDSSSSSDGGDAVLERGSEGESTADLTDLDDTTSDDELSRARKKEADKIALPSFPTMLQLSSFKAEVVEAIVTASCRIDHQRVIRWAQRVEIKGTK